MTRLCALILALLAATTVAASDRYEGYYYPQITSVETFDRVIRTLPGSSKAVRVSFVTSITAAHLSAAESPRFVFFAKGDDARHLSVIALDDDVFSTIYRARAVLAQLTSTLRSNDVFGAQELQLVATFFDLLQVLEFDTLVISDGETWAHEVTFTRN